MNERTTNSTKTKNKEKKVQAGAKITDTEGMGARRKRHRDSRQISNSPPDALSMEEGFRERSADIFKRQEAKSRHKDKTAGERKPKAKRDTGRADQRADGGKKRDEFGLSGRHKGISYSQRQKQLIIQEVKEERVSTSATLRFLGVCRSTYYRWLSKDKKPKVAANQLIQSEKEAIIDKKRKDPHLSHRQISGLLREDGYWISASSCYRVLRSIGWVWAREFREAPWKEPHYEPYRPNQIWGEDWTSLTIAGKRYYLLTIIDNFSRYIVAWGIVKTVTRHEVQELVALAYMSEGIEYKDPKPIFRMDRGSANIARSTKRLIKDLEMILSFSRVHRPTDNSRQERWYRTIKQEEVYCYPQYESVENARSAVGHYIEYYNEKRPHQALWNYAPGYVHRLGNKTLLLRHYKDKVRLIKEQRLQINQINK